MAESTKATTKATVTNPWDKKVEVMLPKATNGDSNYLIASVNGRVFKIKRGVKVEVPAPIAEVIEHSFNAQNEADEFIDAKTEK